MSIVDIIIYTIDWIFQNTLLAILPTNAPGLSYDDFVGYMAGVSDGVIDALSGLGFILPLEMIFVLVLIAITAEFSLFAFHIILFLVHLVRG